MHWYLLLLRHRSWKCEPRFSRAHHSSKGRYALDRRKVMEIRISIETTEPLAGTATAGSREPVRFEGWLDLLRVLSALVGPKSGSDPEK